MNVILDAGALIAIEAGDATVAALVRTSASRAIPVRTSAGVVAQVWRSGARQARLARLLAGVEVVAIDEIAAKRVGVLLARNGTADVVDAHVAELARRGDLIVTSDPGDIGRLIGTLGVDVAIESV